MSYAWMPIFWGDYLGKTTHLSCLEHGAYLLLIGTYWQRGKPLPDDDVFLAAVTRNSTKKWKMVRPKVTEFFSVSEGYWTHERVEKELLRSSNRQASAVANGRAGGLAKSYLSTSTSTKKDTVPTVLRASPAPHSNGKSNGSANGHLAAPVGTSLADNATLTPAELRREFWRSSVAYLKRCGIKDARSRELLGSWCKRSDQGTVIQLLGQAEVSAIIDPVPYIEAALKKNATNRNLKNGNGHSDSGNAYGSREWFAQAVKANWDFAPGEKEKYETKYGAIQ